jgi:hypothetical protein
MAAIFPAAVATQIQLLTPLNNTLVTLDANCDLDDDVLTVDDASALPDSGYLTFVDTDEIIYYTGKTSNTLTGVTRGADGSSAIGHLAGVDLEMRWNADYHNILTQEIVAIEDNIRDRFGLNTNIVVPTGVAFQVTDGLGIGSALVAKSILSLTSTTLGFLPPRMTTVQRDAITSVPEGLTLYDTTTHLFNVHNGTAWKQAVFSGAIVDADIAAGAAIAVNKLAALTVSSLVATDASGFLTVVSGVSDTEAGYLNGVTSAIQTQIDGKVADTGDTMTGNLEFDNQMEVRWREADANGDHYVGFKASASMTASYTVLLPAAAPGTTNHVLTVSDHTTGQLSWAAVTASGTISLDAGTAGSPSVFFTSDTNTGIYSQAADIISFSVGGARQMYIGSGVLALDASVQLQADGNASGEPVYSFYDRPTWGMGSTVGALYFKVESGKDYNFYVGASQFLNLSPSGAQIVCYETTKTIDFGISTQAWDDVYADDFQNVADIPFFDFVRDAKTGELTPVDDLAVIRNIKPAKDENGAVLFNENGHAYWDDSTVPSWVFTQNKRNRDELVRDPTGKPWVSLKVLCGLALGGVAQIDKRVDDVEARLKAVEDKIAA